MEGLLSPDTIQELLKYPLLIMMMWVIWFNNKNITKLVDENTKTIDRLAQVIDKFIEVMNKVKQ